MMKRHYATAILCFAMLVGTTNAQAPATSLHAEWDILLQKHVTDGQVDYGGMKKDLQILDSYLALLGKTKASSLPKNGQLAYWINAYNAFTMKLILNHYPLKSIRDIKKPWKQKSWKAGGKTLSLNDIEHEILRKEFKEPRIHFAIVCASIGCPDLWNRAYTGKTIRKELDNATRHFMESSKHVKTSVERRFLRKKENILHVSRIFNWFTKDFTAGGKRSVPDFVAKYASDEVKEVIDSAGGKLSIKYLKYDWGLNEKK